MGEAVGGGFSDRGPSKLEVELMEIFEEERSEIKKEVNEGFAGKKRSHRGQLSLKNLVIHDEVPMTF
jgi:hypothetical protein